MNRRPPQPSDARLDAEERALAAMLPRPHGRVEPGPELDARILAAAHAATRGSGGGTRPPHRRSWIAPTALAASLVLAVGLAWQLRPPPSLPAPAASESAPAAAASDSETAVLRAVMPPPAAEAAPIAVDKPAAAAPPAEPRVPVPARAAPAPVEAEQKATMATPAPPPPPPPAAVVLDTPAAAPVPAPRAQAAEAAPAAVSAAPAMAKSAQAGAIARERIAVSANAAEDRDEAARAADAAKLDAFAVDDPGEDVPPATADAPEVRTAWLRRIGELLKQGKTEEAKASLAEFRRRYPDAPLPPELRGLED